MNPHDTEAGSANKSRPDEPESADFVIGLAGDTRRQGETGRGSQRSRIAQAYALVGAWAIVIVIFGVLRPDIFLSPANFSTIFGSQSVLVMLALALLIPLIAGDFDLSVASVLTISSMVVAVLNVQLGWPIVPAIVVALVVGVVTGAINGALMIYFGIESLIVTLGTGTVLQGLTLWMSGANTISGVSPDLVNLVVVTRVFGIPLEFFYAITLTVLIWYVFEFTPAGRQLVFVGRSRSVSRLSGIRVSFVRMGALIAAGFIAAVAGVVYVGTTGAADPNSGASFLLPAFAANFLGATSLVPGRFNPWGTVIAVYFLVTGITGLQLLGAENYVQQLFYGGALIVAVALSQIARRRQVTESG